MSLNPIFVAIGAIITSDVFIILLVALGWWLQRRKCSTSCHSLQSGSLIESTYRTSPETKSLRVLQTLQELLVYLCPENPDPNLGDVKCVVEDMQLAHGGHAPLEYVIQTLAGQDLRRQQRARKAKKELQRIQAARQAALVADDMQLLTPVPA